MTAVKKETRSELEDSRDYWRDMFLTHEKVYEQEKNDAIFERMEFEVAKLELKPGDVVALTAPGMITNETAKRLKEHFERALPGVTVLIMADGLKVIKQ